MNAKEIFIVTKKSKTHCSEHSLYCTKEVILYVGTNEDLANRIGRAAFELLFLDGLDGSEEVSIKKFYDNDFLVDDLSGYFGIGNNYLWEVRLHNDGNDVTELARLAQEFSQYPINKVLRQSDNGYVVLVNATNHNNALLVGRILYNKQIGQNNPI